jgi:hypothetical protein
LRPFAAAGGKPEGRLGGTKLPILRRNIEVGSQAGLKPYRLWRAVIAASKSEDRSDVLAHGSAAAFTAARYSRSCSRSKKVAVQYLS